MVYFYSDALTKAIMAGYTDEFVEHLKAHVDRIAMYVN